MTCTVTYITSCAPDAEDRAHKRGRLPTKPVKWNTSVWMIAPNGEKTTHSFTVPSCTAHDLIPAIAARIDELARENGQHCTQFGWTASAHGGTKIQGRRR